MNTIQLNSTGPDVQRWQTVIGIAADGSFGPQTLQATKDWQSAHGIAPDGVVGPQTWAAAGLAPEYTGTGTRVAQTSTAAPAKKVATVAIIPIAKPSFFTTVKNKLPAFPILLAVGLLGLGATAAIYKASK